MAQGRFHTMLMLLCGAAAGFTAALYLEAPPAPAPGIADPREPAEVPRDVEPSVAAPRAAVAESAEPSTLAGILRIDSDFAQTAALYDLIDEMSTAELEQLIGETDSVPGASDRRAALSILYARYADLDPVAALAFLERRGGSHAQTELRSVFHAWSRSDLTAALEAAAALPQQMRAIAGTAILIARDDLAADQQRAIARRLGIENALPQIAAQQSLDDADRDPQAAWQDALAAQGALRQSRLSAIAQGWARADPLAAMEAVMSLSNPALRNQLQAQVLHEWSRRNPDEAVGWALSQPPTAHRQHLTATALSALAGTQPHLALEYAQALEGQERDHALGRVLSRWATEDPVAAAASLDLVTSMNARRNALGTIASAFVRRDPQRAVQWLATLNPQETTHATIMMFSVLGNQDPALAGTLVSRLPDDQSRQLAATSVAQTWVQQDPQAAAQWVETLTDETLRSRAAASLAGHWASFDREAALRYAERIPAAAERDAALVSVIQSHYGDLAFAEQLFERLTVPEQRSLAARQLYLNLRESDPVRAERYRELAGFPPGFGTQQ